MKTNFETPVHDYKQILIHLCSVHDDKKLNLRHLYMTLNKC